MARKRLERRETPQTPEDALLSNPVGWAAIAVLFPPLGILIAPAGLAFAARRDERRPMIIYGVAVFLLMVIVGTIGAILGS